MPMTEKPEEINDAERYVDTSIWKEGQEYAERNARSKEENEGRKESRERIKKLGMSPNAFHTAVGLVKKLTQRELDDWLRDFNASLGVLRQRQSDLFPIEAAAAAKREEKRLQRAAEAKTKAGVDPDTNPRSDPNAGGAKPQTLKEAAAASEAAVAESLKNVSGGTGSASGSPNLKIVGTGDQADLKSNVPTPPNPPGEAEEGEAALNDGLSQTKSQSQIAAEKRAAAKVP